MSGWVIAVMIEPPGEPEPVRHFYAVGFEDRAKAEWTAIDAAGLIGPLVTSPVKGQEPVQAMKALPPARMKRLGLQAGQVRALGPLWPRAWL